jgi:transposase
VEHYAGLDVSLELTSVCIVDAQGRIVRETKVPSDPEDLVRYFRALEHRITRIALEAGPLSQWIHAGLTAAGFETVLLETRHVKAALSAMNVKTDRRDARGIAQLLRLGWYRPVHAKSASSQEVRALLTGRKLIQAKLLDVESGMRGVLRGFGLKVGSISRGAGRRRRASHWHASSASSSTGCGSMGPSSAGPTRRLQSHKNLGDRAGLKVCATEVPSLGR